MMTTLLYRGHSYVQHKEAKTQKDCVELTYRRNHYNTCRNNAKHDMNAQLSYRGQKYRNQFDYLFTKPCLAGLCICLYESYLFLSQATITFFTVLVVWQESLIN